MKQIKPGQFCSIDGMVLRARSKTIGCEGCVFKDNISRCPGVFDAKKKQSKIDCTSLGIIFTK